MRATMFFLLAAMLSACQTESNKPAPILVEELMDVWWTGDSSTLSTIVSSDAKYDDVPNNHVFEGIEGFQQYVGHVHSWASNVEMTVDRIGGDEGKAYAEWTMTGVQSSPIQGRLPEATNRNFTLRGLTLVEVDQGKITRAADYIDVLGFVVQLGARVELPGGVVIQMDE